MILNISQFSTTSPPISAMTLRITGQSADHVMMTSFAADRTTKTNSMRPTAGSPSARAESPEDSIATVNAIRKRHRFQPTLKCSKIRVSSAFFNTTTFDICVSTVAFQTL
jgi:hypothetical protein